MLRLVIQQVESAGGLQEQVNILTFMRLVQFYWDLFIDLVYLHQVFVKKVIELHNKYMAYLNNCFSNSTLFHKVWVAKLNLSSFVGNFAVCV